MTFSIVVPVYNVNPVFLDQCVYSILSQSFSDFELILVDDGSTDDSGKRCDTLATMDSRISVIHKQNGGVSSARNEGISAAKGEWLLFCDADDTLQENCLELVFQTISDKNYDLYKFHYNLLKRNGNFQDVPYALFSKTISNIDFIKLVLRHKILGSCWGYVFRTEHAKSIKFNHQLTISEDTLFLMHYLLKVSSNIYVSSFVIYHYRDTPESASKGWNHKSLMIDSVNHLIGALLKQYAVFDQCKVEYNTFVIQNLTGTSLWMKKLPSRENQLFLINNIDTYYEEDINIIMKRYVNLLKTSRIIGNSYLVAYYIKIRLFTKISQIL